MINKITPAVDLNYLFKSLNQQIKIWLKYPNEWMCLENLEYHYNLQKEFKMLNNVNVNIGQITIVILV